jgi:hypothetical protein
MGLPIPPSVDGVVLADGVRGSDAGDAKSEQAVEAGRMADVTALIAHSKAQHGMVLKAKG